LVAVLVAIYMVNGSQFMLMPNNGYYHQSFILYSLVIKLDNDR